MYWATIEREPPPGEETMMSVENIDSAGQDAILPQHVADAIVSSETYTDEQRLYESFAWMREHMPVGKAFVEGYDPIWIVTHYSDIMAISRDAKTFCNGDHNLILQTRESDAFTRRTNKGKVRSMNSLAYMDRPEHAIYRSVTATSFMPGRVRKLEADMRSIARASVAELLEKGAECDFVKDFAMHYPLRVIMSLLGVPEADEPRMLKLTQQLFGGDDPDERREGIAAGPDAAARAWRATLEDFYDYFRHLSRSRRAEPKDDLISLIANYRVDGDYIDEDREFDYYIAIATAGHDTTSSATAGGMLGMMRYPAQFAKLKADIGLAAGFVDEAIRWSVPIKHFMRSAAEDAEVRGQRIRKNDRLMLCYPSANRDEDVFADADAFDIERNPNQHLAFGNGPHMCIGQHLAKLDMRVLFEELMPHLAAVELAGEPRYVQSNFISGLKSLPVRIRST